MNISKITNSLEIGSFSINQDFLKPKIYKKPKKEILLQSNLININYLISDNELNKKNCHVYFFCVDDEVFKIGASQSSVIDNMNYYVERAISGGFSPTRFTCHMLIYASLKNNKKVKVHAITYDNVNVSIKNLDSETSEDIELSAKNLEAICIKQFLDKNGFYPEWNLQERGQEYPEKIYQLMNSYREFRKNDNHSLTENNNELISHFRRCKDYNLV